ncbi:MAG: multidrug resistance protein [Rickettsiaceae bacterium]|jgi:subfamily B ATP-binding cassette protein MsbA|nr:multidrug resistance protein [Rickettsiaceae bacterium]
MHINLEENLPEIYPTIAIFRRLFKDYIKPYKWKILLAVFFMIIVAICSAVLVNLVKPAIDQIFVTRDKTMLLVMPLMMLLVTSIKGVSEYFQYYLIRSFGQRILTDMQMALYRHLLYADLSLITQHSAGRLISRFTNDITLMRGAVSNLLIGMAKHFLSATLLVFVMFKLEPELSIVVFFVFPLAIYPVMRIGRKMRKISSSTQEELGNYTAKLDEVFTSIRVIKSYQGEEKEFFRAKSIVENIFKLYKRAARFDSLTSPIMEILSGVAFALILWYGGIKVMNGKSTPGSLVAFITAFFSAYRPLKSLVALNINLQDGLAAAKRLFMILDVKPQIVDQKGAVELLCKQASIEFKDISLQLSEREVIKNLNLKVPAGKTVAIVGKSGSGKTTLTNLLVRFYETNQGQIFINNLDINQITIDSIRRHIALVTQDIMLFDATVAENIAYGKPDATREEILEAAKAANAEEFIENLPQKYDTIIGTNGTTLSGGQRQRLSIARAFLKDAPILILDEATSALDPISEKEVQHSLKRLQKGKTTIIIAHKLSSIIDADIIFVMKEGEIVEQGLHNELIARKGEYYSLYNEQDKNE